MFDPSTIWIVVKVFFLLGIALYIAFAAVVVKQIQLMIEAVEAPFTGPLRIIGWTHLFLAIAVFLLALAIL